MTTETMRAVADSLDAVRGTINEQAEQKKWEREFDAAYGAMLDADAAEQGLMLEREFPYYDRDVYADLRCTRADPACVYGERCVCI